MAQQRTTASEPCCSPNEAECEVRTFYSIGDVSEEVDSHFAKALKEGAGKHSPSCSGQPTSPTLPTKASTPRATDSSNKPSPPMSSSVAEDKPAIANISSIGSSNYTSPDTSQVGGSPTAQQHLPALAFHTAGPDSPVQLPRSGSAQLNKARIIYPEFVKFVVHPEVDSFKDLPKLPGQSSNSPPFDWQSAWSTDEASIGRWTESTNKDLEQLSTQNQSILTKGYHSERTPLHHHGSSTIDTATGDILGSHRHLYRPHLLPLQPVDLQYHRGLETRHSRPSQMHYTGNSLSTTTEHSQLQSGLEFTNDELKEILELREHDI